MFSRWRCLTHYCGSYNFNQLGRHSINGCDIVKENTVGIIKPKTYGGFNGDLGRGFIKEYLEMLRQGQIQESAIARWNKFKVKNDKKFKRIQRYKRKYNSYR